MTLILQSLYFILPAYMANMAPVIVNLMSISGRRTAPPRSQASMWLSHCERRLSLPISEQLFGAHKTWRGIFAGVLGGVLAVWLQKILSPVSVAPFELLPYAGFGAREVLLYGTAFGGGALLGDLAKSFIKRRIGIAPGRPFIPFDQLDFIFGALVAVSPLYFPPWQVIAAIIIMTPLLHLLVNVEAYRLKLKDVWW